MVELKHGVSQSRRRSIIRDFALNTSTHALPGIARSQSLHNRLFWTLSFLAFTGIMTFFIVQSITHYFQYQTQTTIAIVVERDQIFPAVTICNLCPGRFDRILPPFLDYLRSRNLTNPKNTSLVTPQQARFFRDFLIYSVNSGENMTQYFFSLDIMLMSCVYNDQSCNTSDFVPFVSSTFGLCHTFNARRVNTTDKTLRRVNENGCSGRLQLRFYTHNQLYLPYVLPGPSAGIVTMVHDNTELPMIEVASVELAAGRKHKLSYRKKANYFLPPPYTECTNKAPDVMQQLLNRVAAIAYDYSQGFCYTLCTQAYVYRKCGCVSHLEWLARSVKPENSTQIIVAPLCNRTDPCYGNATNELTGSEALWNEYCSECKQQCTIIDYIVTTSAVSAPSQDATIATKQFVESRGVPLAENWTTNWEREVENNYVGLDVVCQTLLVENYTQEASMGSVDVLSNVGGHTGLWIGMSFLSLMEVVEMVYRLARHECRRLMSRWLKKNPDDFRY